MNATVARDVRAWTVITVLIVVTGTAASDATTPGGFTRLAALAATTLIALLAWARVKAAEEIHHVTVLRPVTRPTTAAPPHHVRANRRAHVRRLAIKATVAAVLGFTAGIVAAAIHSL